MPTLYMDNDPSRQVIRHPRRLDSHGLKLSGIRKAATATRETIPGKLYSVIYYNPVNGEISTSEHASGQSYLYQSPPVLYVATTCHPLTMQAIADAVAAAVELSQDMPF